MRTLMAPGRGRLDVAALVAVDVPHLTHPELCVDASPSVAEPA